MSLRSPASTLDLEHVDRTRPLRRSCYAHEMSSENVAAAGDQLPLATPDREQRRPHHRGTTWLALLVAALAVVLYSLGNKEELVTRRLSALLGETSSEEVLGQHAEPNGLYDFPALPPLADRNRLWPPAIGELNALLLAVFCETRDAERLALDSCSTCAFPRRPTDLQAENLRECCHCLLRDMSWPGHAP